MKSKTVVILVVLALIVLMVRNPRKTTAEIQTGIGGAAGVGGATASGLFGNNGNQSTGKKKGG